MRLWPLFYRAIGGRGPKDDPSRGWRPGGRLPFSSTLAYWLVRLGFLSRDPKLSEMAQGFYINFRWQWRFWRGPYHNAMLALGLKPLSWWNTALQDINGRMPWENLRRRLWWRPWSVP